MSGLHAYLIAASLWFIADSTGHIKRLQTKQWLFAFARRHLNIDLQNAIARGDAKRIFHVKCGLIIGLLLCSLMWPYMVMVEIASVHDED